MSAASLLTVIAWNALIKGFNAKQLDSVVAGCGAHQPRLRVGSVSHCVCDLDLLNLSVLILLQTSYSTKLLG